MNKIKNYIKEKLSKRGFLYFSSQKLDGAFDGYFIFRKEWNESWEKSLKRAIQELQDRDDRLHDPVIIKFFNKL